MVDQEKLTRILSTASEQDAVKLKVLYNAAIATVKTYNETPTSANLRDWKAAETALDEAIAHIDAETSSASGSAASPTSFRNLLEVLRYLKSEGWKISQPGIYKHRDQGKLAKAGPYSLQAVNRYARANLKLADGTPTYSAKLEQIQEERADAERRRMVALADKEELRAAALKGDLVPKASVELELASRAAVFRSDDENWIYAIAARIIEAVGGDSAREPELIDLLRTSREEIFARYASETSEFTSPPEQISFPGAISPAAQDPDELADDNADAFLEAGEQ